MDSSLNEKNIQNIESKYKTFLKSSNNFFIQEQNQTKSKNNNTINNQFIINDNINIKKKNEDKKLNFTNLILRKKLGNSKTFSQININKFMNSNKKEISKEDPQLEKLLDIHKLLNISSIKTNNKIKIKNTIIPEKVEKKKNIRKNLSISIYNNIKKIKNNKKFFLKKVSKGQQTILDNEHLNANEFQSDSPKNSLEANLTLDKRNPPEKIKLKEIIKRNNENNNNKIIKNVDGEKKKINEKKKKEKNEIKNEEKEIKKDDKIKGKKEEKKEEKKQEEITDYMNNINIPNSNEKYNNNNSSISKNEKSNQKNYKYQLFHNKSNIIDIGNIKFDQKNYSMGLREIYRNLILTEKEEKKKNRIKSVLKNKKIIECLSKNSLISNKFTKKSNNNLVSLENYTNEIEKSNRTKKILTFRKIKDRILIKEFRLIDKNKLFGTTESKKNDDDENFFTNILKCFSRTDEKYNKVKLKMIGN